MSQPKFQLETFKSWAGIDSDISYYLNSHHIDVSTVHMPMRAQLTDRSTAGWSRASTAPLV